MTECLKCKSISIEKISCFNFWDVFQCKECDYWTYKRILDCCRQPYQVVAIEHRNNNSKALYHQCIYCGGSMNRTRALSFKKFGDEIRSEFSKSRYNDWWNAINNERALLAADKKEYNNLNSPKFKYYVFLQSAKWKKIRDLALKRDNYMCQKCLSEKADDVHHLTYENFENEKLSDLISLCRACHKKEHQVE